MSQDEVFDVLNEQMIKVGEATRQNVHGPVSYTHLTLPTNREV